MKNWDDFLNNNEDDEFSNDDERDLFGTHRLQQELEKTMFLQDVQNGHPLVLDPSEYITLFGPIQEEDMEFLTQSFFTHYHRLGVSVDEIFDRWGGDWIFEVLKHCEKREGTCQDENKVARGCDKTAGEGRILTELHV